MIKITKTLSIIFCCFLFIFSLNNLKVLAENRVFLDLKMEFLGEYELKDSTYQDTVIGGLSGITYNPQKNLFYAISDDRAYFSPARFYTLNIDINNNKINKIKVENVTFLKNEKGALYPPNTTDTESIAFSPRNTLFIASEGVKILIILLLLKNMI